MTKKTLFLIFFSGILGFFLMINVVFAQPSTPQLSSPTDGAGNVPIEPTLTWSGTIPAGGYFQVYLSDGGTRIAITFGNSLKISPVDLGLEYALTYNTSYAWTVRACTADGDCSPWALPYWTFTTEPAPVAGPAPAPGQPGVQGISFSLISCQRPCPDPNNPNALCNPICAESFQDLISIIINVLFWLAMVIGPLMILVAAFYFITASGNPSRVETAKKIILYTLIGLLIIFLAKGLISVVRGVLGG